MFWRHTKWAFAWALVILILCGLPGTSFPRLSFLDWLRPDKVVHLFLFGIESFLLISGFSKQSSYPILNAKSKLLGVLIAISYGALVEVLQSTIFIGRSGDIRDALANALGAFLGLVIFNYLQRTRSKAAGGVS
jgi:VanZ family protein